ncbi:MAG: hypothetical protein SVZ03_07100 [Spirochaetota bacterium]|nr:hypothetical protein [Spirochaetota bacterium]
MLTKLTTIRNTLSIIIGFFIIMGMNNSINAQEGLNLEEEEKEYDLGISAGLWLSGDISLNDYNIDIEKSASLLLRAIGDMYVAPKFAVGGYINISRGDVSYASEEETFTMFEFGMSFKPRFEISHKQAIKPGLNIGYRKLDIPDYDDAESDGLGVNLSVEWQFFLESGYIFYIDGGFLSQPSGGNDDTDVTWSPILYLLGGVAF